MPSIRGFVAYKDVDTFVDLDDSCRKEITRLNNNLKDINIENEKFRNYISSKKFNILNLFKPENEQINKIIGNSDFPIINEVFNENNKPLFMSDIIESYFELEQLYGATIQLISLFDLYIKNNIVSRLGNKNSSFMVFETLSKNYNVCLNLISDDLLKSKIEKFIILSLDKEKEIDKINALELEMKEAANNLEFERAMELKNEILELKNKQKKIIKQ